MQKLKRLISLCCIFMMQFSCNENKNTVSPSNLPTQTIPPSSDSSKKPIIGMPASPKKTGYTSVFPKGTWKTYPQIVKSIFGVGSTKEEVLNIMGRPELTEHPSDGYEKWFYGKFEITFKYAVAEYVNSADICPKYVSYEKLITSDDPIEKRFGIKLLSSAANN